LWILIAVVVVLLIGAAVFFFMRKGGDDHEEDTVEMDGSHPDPHHNPHSYEDDNHYA
jgi:flagellar basal body-associated protein FliL